MKSPVPKGLAMKRLALLLALVAVPARADDYPRTDLLVEVADAAKAKDFIILDARTQEKYAADHLPGAVWVPHDAWSKTFSASQNPAEWGEKIGALGIAPGSKVLVYDDAVQKDAARIWWILRYFGAKDVRLLNGGWPAHVAAGLPKSTDIPKVTAATFKIAAPDAARFADKTKVLSVLKDKSAQIVDARSEKEYCGDVKMSKQGGHIPGAILLEWTDALDKTTQKFKSPEQLKAILKEAGIDATKPIVTHCQSGGRAAVMTFTLELMGAPNVSNYYRGWSEWGNADDTPIVATPKKK